MLKYVEKIHLTGKIKQSDGKDQNNFLYIWDIFFVNFYLN